LRATDHAVGRAEPSRRGKLDGVVLGTLDGVVDSLGVVDGVVLVVERLDPARGITINAGRVVSLTERARKCDLKAAAARLRSSGPINSWMFHGRPAGPCVVASFLEMPLRMVPLRGGGKTQVQLLGKVRDLYDVVGTTTSAVPRGRRGGR